MNYTLDHYIDENERAEILRTATDDSMRRKLQAKILTNNCLVKFRGWDGENPNTKSRERVIKSIKGGQLFFSTALGYNDPYDTLMYIDKEGLLNFIERALAVQMPAYIESQKTKNFCAGCFAQMYNTLQSRQQFVRYLDGEIEKIKNSIHDGTD